MQAEPLAPKFVVLLALLLEVMKLTWGGHSEAEVIEKMNRVVRMLGADK